MAGKKNILITGASGFVGAPLGTALRTAGFNVTGTVRKDAGPDQISTGDINGRTDWSFLSHDATPAFDAIIHTAARVHVMEETAANPLEAFRQTNVEGTKRLAEAAAKAGAQRFIFLSSIKVNGEATFADEKFKASDLPNPQDPYAISKWEAEQALHDIAAKTDLEVVILRPPLIYGPGVKGNMLRLLKLVSKGYPLPFGLINNRRSMISLANLNDFIVHCLKAPQAEGQTFLLSDDDDLSTPELIKKLATAMKRPARLLPVPAPILKLGGFLTGRGAEIERLLGSLQIDITHSKNLLHWQPSVSVDSGLKTLVEGYSADEHA